jgi:protein gp37
MADKTKIDWADATWNPVTGCLHGCEYCYARRIAERFGWHANEPEINDRVLCEMPVSGGRKVPYPFDFQPTFHKYRLDIPARWTRPRTIFVCSMADLFGEWVPDEWIQQVFDACRKAPQHRYLFLTKNPDRYDALEDAGLITPDNQNFWLGSTVTVETRDKLHGCGFMHTFQSCEPMLAPWPPAGKPNENYRSWWPEWVIFGAETGNRKGKVIPEKAWVDNAVQMCRNIGAAVFMKESLREIMGADFLQEFPWEV